MGNESVFVHEAGIIVATFGGYDKDVECTYNEVTSPFFQSIGLLSVANDQSLAKPPAGNAIGKSKALVETL